MKDKTVLFILNLVNAVAYLILKATYSTMYSSISCGKKAHISGTRKIDAYPLNTANFLLFTV
jgi:hypothetical protein